MIEIHNGVHWKPARGQPELITKGERKGKYKVLIFSGNPEHPEGLSYIIVDEANIREREREEGNKKPPHYFKLLISEQVKKNHIIQMELFK